ncbi:hypothetical protein AXF42_Ash006215 [Apostasia shenzhenica]|uniref:Uncharacterized protein n=1 Tax=Apostasia shenzhenica TaxID=1088818 RepID=A0A2I0B0K5_9ASPA|nr:hypothetical protein AXF42_Ash006215 [Apostasia shenzhenica]
MARSLKRKLMLILAVSSALLMATMAARPIEDPEEEDQDQRWAALLQDGSADLDEDYGKIMGILLQSLPKGPTTPQGPSGCTHNPNNHGGICPQL